MSAFKAIFKISLSLNKILLPFSFIKIKQQVRFFLTRLSIALRVTFSSTTYILGLEKLLKLLLKAEIFSYLLKKFKSKRPKIKNTAKSRYVGLKLMKHKTIKIKKKKEANNILKIIVSFIALFLSINLAQKDTKTLPPSRGYAGKRLKSAITKLTSTNGERKIYETGNIHQSAKHKREQTIFVKGPAKAIKISSRSSSSSP